MKRYLALPVCRLRYSISIFAATALFFVGAGLSPAISAPFPPEEKTVASTVSNTTVISKTDAGAVGLTLPGMPTNQPQVSLDDIPEEYRDATEEVPIASSKLTHSAISSYETANGTQTFIRIDSDKAAREYWFSLDLPEGAETQLLESGAVLIKDSQGEIIGGYYVPWAIDANGEQVPTQFAFNGDKLIQTIDFTPDIVFPVIADPNGWWGWTQCAAAIGGLVAINAIAAFKIAKIGGIARAINILKTARTRSQTWQVLKQIFGEITGIGSVLRSCF